MAVCIAYFRYGLLIILVTGVIFTASLTEINIVAVVDAETPYAQDLEDAVAFLNDPSTPLLQGATVKLQVVSTLDNESYNATLGVCEQLKRGVQLVIDLSSLYVTKAVRCVTDMLGVAHVSAVDPSFEDTDSSSNTSVNIRPPASVLLLAIRDSVAQENLTNLGIIYDHTFNLDNKPKRLLRNIPAQHLYMRMAITIPVIELQLQKIKEAELHHLFLACNAENAQRYLGIANMKGMMNFKYDWYIITKDPEVPCPLCARACSVVTLTGRVQPAPAQTHRTFMAKSRPGRPATWQQPELASAFHFDLVNLLGRALDRMVLGGGWVNPAPLDCSASIRDPATYSQSTDLIAAIKQIQYSSIVGPIRWTGDVADLDITLEVNRVKFKDGIQQSVILIGNWSVSKGLRIENGSITNKDIKKKYKIVTVKEPPFIFKEKTLPTGADAPDKFYYNETTGYYYFGYCIDLIFKIKTLMNFEFELYEPDDLAYGIVHEDGTWNGMVRQLIDEHADIAVAPLSVMAEREGVIDFTVPYYDLVGITILMKKPTFTYSVFKFLNVLEEAVWGCVFSAFIIVSVLLSLFDRFSPYSYQNNKPSWDGTGDEPRIFTLKEGLWFCMTSLTPQGGGEAPRALSGRLVAATWWMFGFIMIATYTANLAAFLTVSRLDQPVESLDDLAKQFKTKYAPQNSTSTATYFRRMADIEEKFYSIWKGMSLNDSLDQMERAKLAVWDYPVSDRFTNMWVAMAESGFPQSFSEALQRVKQRNYTEEFAFIGDATQNKYATLTDCELWEVGEEFSRKPYALAVQEGSQLKNQLSSIILLLLNQRFLEDLKTKWWDFNKTKCDKIEDESDGISIQNIGGVFIVIFIGIGLGLITLAFEYYWYKWRPQQHHPAHAHSARPEKRAHDNHAFSS